LALIFGVELLFLAFPREQSVADHLADQLFGETLSLLSGNAHGGLLAIRSDDDRCGCSAARWADAAGLRAKMIHPGRVTRRAAHRRRSGRAHALSGSRETVASHLRR